MRARHLIVGLTAATVSLSGCSFSLYGTNLPGGTDTGDNPYTVTAYFANVLDLVPQSNVKVNDVAVGKVTKIVLSKKGDPSGSPATNGWTAKVTLELRNNVSLPSNARARIEQTSLLGDKYVQLAQPFDTPSSTKLHNGSVIPLVRTGSAPEVEEVLGALSLVLNGGGIQQIHTIAQELNNALHGHEGAVRDLLTQLQTFTGSLDAQKNRIVDALVSLDNLSKTLNKQSDVLVATLNTMPQALKILADEKNQLLTMLQSLAKLGTVATDVLSKTQTQMVSALKAINPTLVNLTSTGQNLTKMLKIAGTFPFPVGLTRQAVRGDYANLHLYLNLNLKDELCALGIAKAPKACTKVKTQSARQAKVVRAASSADSLEPALLGTGR